MYENLDDLVVKYADLLASFKNEKAYSAYSLSNTLTHLMVENFGCLDEYYEKDSSDRPKIGDTNYGSVTLTSTVRLESGALLLEWRDALISSPLPFRPHEGDGRDMGSYIDLLEQNVHKIADKLKSKEYSLVKISKRCREYLICSKEDLSNVWVPNPEVGIVYG